MAWEFDETVYFFQSGDYSDAGGTEAFFDDTPIEVFGLRYRLKHGGTSEQVPLPPASEGARSVAFV